MNKITIIISAIMLIIACLTGCQRLDNNETDSKEANEVTLVSQNNSQIATETNDVKVFLEQSTWEGFAQSLLGNEMMTNAVDSNKNQILLNSLEIDGFQTSSLNYKEYLPTQESLSSDWEFNVYWEEVNLSHISDSEIRHHLFYCSNGVDILAATNGYTKYNNLDDVYIKRINNGKTAYVCLLSNNMFMRIVISNSCPNFESVSQQLIAYANEIKQMINTGEVQ